MKLLDLTSQTSTVKVASWYRASRIKARSLLVPLGGGMYLCLYYTCNRTKGHSDAPLRVEKIRNDGRISMMASTIYAMKT